MTITYKDQIQEPLPASSTQVYLAGTVTSAHIIYAAAHNKSTSNVSIVVNVIRSGDSASTDNRYISKTVAAGDTLVLNQLLNRVMNTGDSIYATAGDGSSLNLAIGIKEVIL